MLRWYVSVDFRQLVLWTWGAFFMASILCPVGMHFIDEYGDASRHVALFARDVVYLIPLSSFMGICDVMSKFNKKPARSSFLMLPASNMEKYLSMLVYVTVILPVCIFFGFVLGDTLRMAVRVWLYDAPWQSYVPDMLRSLGFDFSDPSWLPFLILNVLTIAWLLSLYVLGATFLRRYSFVVSSIVIVLSFVAFWQFQGSLGLSMFYVKQVDGRIVYQGLGSRAYALFILLPLLTAFNFWASYRIFKRFQLVTNKWTNYDVFKR